MLKFYRSVLTAGVVALGLAACGDDVSVVNPPPPPPPGVTSVTVTPPNATVGIGQTVQLAASVVADSGVATTVAWSSSNNAIATVGSSTGLVTGVAAGTTTVLATSTANTARVYAVQITVQANPTGITSFVVTPPTLNLTVGTTFQPSANVQTVPGTTATVTWASSSTAVATVNASTGAITAVANGTAVITATATANGQSTTATIGVTVNSQGAATISLNSITAGATAGNTAGCTGVVGAPVILTNVNCQIDVNINLNAGTQALDSVTVVFIQGSTTKRLGRQNYGNNVAASGNVTVSIGTANFTKNAAAGTATVDLWNGPTTVVAQVWPHGSAGSGTVSDCAAAAGAITSATCANQTMILTNVDGWSADLTKPTAIAAPLVPAGGTTTAQVGQPNAGTSYWGGPTATGQTTAELYAVVYDDNPAFPVGSSLNRCSNVLGNGTGCITSVTWTLGNASVAQGGNAATCGTATQTPASQAVAPMSGRYIQVFGTGANANVAALNACAGYENTAVQRDNIVVTASQDAQNNSYPSVGTGLGATLIPNVLAFQATPDSGRFDYKAPVVSTPSIVRTAPAVTGWVNAGFTFQNFASADGGVGLLGTTLATRISAGGLKTTYSAAATATSTGCGNGSATNAMATGTGADIPECPILTNSLGGAIPTANGTAPYTVKGIEVDKLGNTGTSAASASFGVDKTAPFIRWGLGGDPVVTVPAVNAIGLEVNGVAGGTSVTVSGVASDDTLFTTKPTTQAFRAEFNDDRSGFIAVGGGNSPQTHFLETAGHVNPAGICVAFPITDPLTVPGTTPAAGIGAAFVTAPNCTLINTTAALVQRIDGWQSGQTVAVPQPEGYYFYKTTVFDAAGNQSAVLSDRATVNSRTPFATGLNIPATLTSAAFGIAVTASDSVEVLNVSQALQYPNLPTVAFARYTQQSVGTYADNFISSPLNVTLNPPTGAPYVRAIESVTGATWTGTGAAPLNVAAAPVNTKPISAQEWSFNPSNFLAASSVIAIPGLNVQNGVTFNAFNTGNTTNTLTNFRVIPTLSVAGNPFLSGEGLRAQAVSPTGTPNSPFARVDFYQLDAGGTWWNYLGSVQTSNIQPSNSVNDGLIVSDDGVNRSWVYQLGTFVKSWNGTAQTGPVATNTVIAVGVSAAGDGIVSLPITF